MAAQKPLESPILVNTSHLTKLFGAKRAVSDVSLNVAAGEIVALVGPNGAGKTTFLKMLVGLLHPTQGTSSVGGFDIRTRPVSAKRTFGYVPDNPTAYDYLTGREFLEFTGRLRGMDPTELSHRITEVANVFPIKDIFDEQMRSYSRGNRQKLAVLAAILDSPRVLFIDEPIVGLDPESIDILGGLLRSFVRQDRAVLFVTHILTFAQKYATRAGLMHRGVLVSDTPVSKTVSLESLFSKTV